MKKIFRNYTAERPVRSIVNESPSPPIYGGKEKLFSRGGGHLKEHYDNLEKEKIRQELEKVTIKQKEKSDTKPYYERPVRSVVNERPSPPIYRDKDKIFSRRILFDRLEKKTKESDNAKSSLENEIKKRILTKKES